MNAIIIEDEKAAVRNLTTLLADEIPELKIIAVLDSIKDSLEWFEMNECPELVFMDIHLADGSAFEIFKYADIKCPVIFTTAYDEYALKAFKVNSLDYLLKPIGKQDIRKALDKLKSFSNIGQQPFADYKGIIDSLLTKTSFRTHFLVPVKGDKLLPMPVKDILYFYIREGIVKAVTADGKEYSFSLAMDELVESLDPAEFFRINRQYLISRNSIKDMDLWFNNRLSVNLKRNQTEKILVSKAKVQEFKEWFTGKS